MDINPVVSCVNGVKVGGRETGGGSGGGGEVVGIFSSGQDNHPRGRLAFTRPTMTKAWGRCFLGAGQWKAGDRLCRAARQGLHRAVQASAR